ncbi:MAG: hypothetical protein HN478_09935 [Rhodospirillaceae bacterium]|nr:hypothetical protein [Rhodospirillaceae bacterium]
MLGFEIEKRTDFLALAAFIIALLGALYQVFGFLKGADVKLFSPPQVLMLSSANSAGEQVVQIHARMALVNSGEPGYHASVSSMNVRFQLGGKTYEQNWQLFQTYDNKQDVLVPHFVSDARPFPIKAGSADSHETLFAPHPIRCRDRDEICNKWKNIIYFRDFLAAIEKLHELAFTFTAEIFGESRVSITCVVDMDDDVRDNLIFNGWSAPICWPVKKDVLGNFDSFGIAAYAGAVG